MLSLPVALCLCVQPPSDLPFRHAVESFIYDTHRVSRFAQVLTDADARLLRILACSSYDARQLAREALEQHADPLRTLYWGSHSTDAEVSRTCSVLLRRLDPWFRRCQTCDGTGRCVTCRLDSVGDCPCTMRPAADGTWRWGCVECEGTGERGED
jgi:hypothetical protein